MLRQYQFSLAIACVVVVFVLVAAAYLLYRGGQHQGPGTMTMQPVPRSLIAQRSASHREAAGNLGRPMPSAKLILFGDLHSHTTFSADAFFRSLPIFYGEGSRLPADACDFARFCAGLDFFAITDHAETLTPRQWRELQQSVRQCNATASNAENPESIAFLGWEWSQVGITPATHNGHRTVLFRGDGEDTLPARPIAAPGPARRALENPGINLWTLLTVPVLEFPHYQPYLNMLTFLRETNAVPTCPQGIPTHALPRDCREIATSPAELLNKLAAEGSDTLVIPHGTTWGFYTPPGYTFDKEIPLITSDPQRQPLIEIYSGHGSSEQYRDWRAVNYSVPGKPRCPEPSADYQPCCWRAGEIIRSRCGNIPAQECERRVSRARANYTAAGIAGRLAVPGADVEDWQNCGQCTDCFNPAFQYRPGASVQYALARGNFTDPQQPRHLVVGFVAASDNHSARPGTGYKELARHRMTDAVGPRSEAWRDRILGKPPAPTSESLALSQAEMLTTPVFRVLDFARQASFFMTGGLTAVHSKGRSRQAIWEALQRREVYATSGARILLWFELQNGPDGSAPMGTETRLTVSPRFVVQTAGALVQQPGCPESVINTLDRERLQRLCLGECYHPGSARHQMTRIEVVRIRLQQHPAEPLASLIDDPWRILTCPPNPNGCRVAFADPAFVQNRRDTVYYVRAIQEPTPAVNAGGLRCQNQHDCKPCYGDWRTPYEDDCLSENEERAWSSPIFIHYGPAALQTGQSAPALKYHDGEPVGFSAP